MGMIDSTGPMVSFARCSFKISNRMASLPQKLTSTMFGLLSVSIGFSQDNMGKRFVLYSGFAIALPGLVFPFL
jgi:hypothetical protein